MVSNSKKSEIDPRGGVSIFQISLKFKKSEISDGEGGSSLFGNFSKIFPFYFYDGSPKVFSARLIMFLLDSIAFSSH